MAGFYKYIGTRVVDFISVLAKPFSHFKSDQRGNVAIIFGIALMPIVMSGALAIDYSRYSRAYTSMMSAADTALLAASAVMSDNPDIDDDDVLKAMMEFEFNNYMTANFDGAKHGATFTYALVMDRDQRTVTVDMNLNQNTVFADAYQGRTLQSSPRLSSKLTTIPENYVLDIVMCIDATGSMQATLSSVQASASTFDVQLRAELGIEADDPRFKIRVRPIYFRDWKDTLYHNSYPWYYRDGLIAASGFYDLSEEGASTSFQTFLNSEYASRGFDYPEASGACMNEGMRSDWYDVENQTDFPEDENLTLFPIIVVWTDNAIQQLYRTQQYMSNTQPTTYSAFEAQWENPAIIPQDPKLLILFGPENYAGWSTVKTWDNYVHGGAIWDGNSNAISIIADNIVKALPDTLRLTH